MAERLSSLVVTIYGGLLRLYPGRFQQSFAPEMLSVFEDVLSDARARGLPAVLALLARELLELPGNVVREHLSQPIETVGGHAVNETQCPRCGFVGSETARCCARCGRAFITRRAALIDWLERHPRLLKLAIGAALVTVAFLASHTITEAGLYFRGSYVLWLLALGIGALQLGRVWAGEPAGARRGARGLSVLVALALAVLVVRGLDTGIVTQVMPEGWSDAFALPGIELRVSRVETVDGAKAFLGGHDPAAAGPEVRRVATSVRQARDGYATSLLRSQSVDLPYLVGTLVYLLAAAAVGWGLRRRQPLSLPA